MSDERATSASLCSAVGVVRECADGRIAVEIEAPARCQGCDGACLWYRLPSREPLELDAHGDFAVGSRVSITLPQRYLLAGAALLYGVPLAALLAGGAAAAAWLGSDWAAALAAGLALLAAFAAVSLLRRPLERATLRRLAVRNLGAHA